MDVLRLLSEADHRARSGVLPVEASIRRGCSNDASILGDADAADAQTLFIGSTPTPTQWLLDARLSSSTWFEARFCIGSISS